MIKTTIIRNLFEPQRRDPGEVEWKEGMTTSAVASCCGLDAGRVTYWVNGKSRRADEIDLSDGDWVHLVLVPQGFIIPLAIKLAKIAFILWAAKTIIELLFPQDEVNEPPPNKPFFGFNNTYRPEGDAIPVVYGRVKVAPPCINQSVLGNVPAAAETMSPDSYERLNSLFAVSHGPIAGFFNKEADVFTGGDFAGIYTPGYMGHYLDLKINGIESRHYEGWYEWRTGGQNQTAISGAMGYVNYANPGTSYSLGFEILNGTESIPATSGQVAYASRIREDDSTEYVHQFCIDQADRASISFFFPRGLYHQAQDTGNYSDFERVVQVQYWVTDTTGAAIPDKVTVLAAKTIRAATPNPFSCEYAFTFNNPTTVSGASESKGYAYLNSNPDYRLKVDGTGTSGADLALLCPGSPSVLQTTSGGYTQASYDQALQFSWGGWVGVPDWVGGYTSGNRPQAFLWSWGKENAISDQWSMDGAGSPCGAPNMWSPPPPLGVSMTAAKSFGAAAVLFLDVDGVLSGASSASDPQVHLKVYTWEGNNGWNNAGNPNFPNGFVSCFVSRPLGVASSFGEANGTRRHVGFTWDQSTYRPKGATAPSSSTGGKATVYCYCDGQRSAMELAPDGQTLGVGNGGYDNYLYGLRPLAGDFAGQEHVPLRFFADSTSTLRIGGWGNVSTSGSAAFAKSEFGLSEMVFYDGILESGWWSAQFNSGDSFGNWPTSSVASMVGQGQYSAGCRIVCPFDDSEVVNTTFYKNLSATTDTGTTQATGAIEIVNVGNTVKTSGSRVVTAQAGSTLKANYIVEIFAKYPTDDRDRWENTIEIRRLTTWATEVYSYPGIACVSTSIQGNDQISNSRPAITMGVLGRKVDVWDGQNAEYPTFINLWSNNPAWVALDILTNHEYGLGDVFSPDGTYTMLELPAFLEWAQFCDEGVPDAYGDFDFFGIATGAEPGLSIGYPDRITLFFGIMDSTGTLQQTMPVSWAVGKFVSITVVDPGVGMDPEWVTAYDQEGGVNNCTNLMEVVDIKWSSNTAGTYGWLTWVEVTLVFERETWPNGTGLVQDPSTDPFPWSGGINYASTYTGKTRLGAATGYEKRCMFNYSFQSKGKDAWDGVLSIFQAGRAMPLKAGRRIMPIWDRPRDPVGLVGQGNIVKGSFEISYIDPRTVPNAIEIEILDADRDYLGQTIAVDHPSVQGTTEFQEIRKERINYTGCTSRSQATREGIYRLNKYHSTVREAKFSVGPDCIHLMPGDRILVSHDVPEYGEGGRLPVAMVLHNLHPGSENLFSTWTQQGGSCTISSRSLLEAIPHATENPPLVQYDSGVTLAYGVPVLDDGVIEVLAGAAGGDGWEQHPEWSAQHVCYGDGVYPTPDNTSGVTAPLDYIGDLDKRVSFSAYFKQPDGNGGASSSVALVVYRLSGDGGYAKKSHGARFDWNSSGALVFGAFIGDNTGLSSPYGVTTHVSGVIYGGWYRATVSYDNDSATGGGASAVGDYLQARLYYNYIANTLANQPTFFGVLGNVGRGNQFLYAGDPCDIDGKKQSGSYHWVGTYCRSSVATTKIVTDTTIAPPFYDDETDAGAGTAGDHGFVMRFVKSASTSASSDKMMATQVVTLPYTTDAASPVRQTGGGVGYTGQPLNLTCFVRRHRNAADSAYVDAEVLLNVRVGVTQSSVGSGELLTDDGAQIELDYSQSSDTWSVSSSTAITSGGHSITIHNASVAKVRNDSRTTAGLDADWWQVDVSFTSTGGSVVSQAGVQIGSRSTGTAEKSFYAWGFRLHCAAGTSGTTYVSPYPHRGALVWGSMWETNFTDPHGTGEAGTFSIGADLQLDRDVNFTAGNRYEIALRSSFTRDEPRRTDAQEVISVSYAEVPDTGTVVKAARSWISVKPPKTFFPRTGDVYSIGKTGSATEDFIIQEIDTDPLSLERTIKCVSYNESIYDDTTFIISSPGPDGTTGGTGGPGDWGDTEGFSVDNLGLQGEGLDLRASATPYRGEDGASIPSITLNWGFTQNLSMPYKEIRLWCQTESSYGALGAYEYIATLPTGVNSYRYDSPHLDPTTSYRFIAQTVTKEGVTRALPVSPYTTFRPATAPRLLEAPVVTASTQGFKQIYTAKSGNTKRIAAIEGRVGGWIVSTRGFIVDPNAERFTNEALLPVPTNSAGEAQAKVYARSKLLSGLYGKLTIVQGAKAFVDVKSSRQLIAENNWTTASDGSIDGNLAVTSDVLHWNGSSSSLGPIYYTMDELDATSPRRMIPNAIIAGYQVRHENIGDLNFTLESDSGRNWSLEGPMKDDGGNATVEIEWRWGSGSSLSSATWRTFEPGEVYARKVQFRLKLERKNTGDNVKLSRFTAICNDVPATTMVDGGTF